jgi:hypothetical protein
LLILHLSFLITQFSPSASCTEASPVKNEKMTNGKFSGFFFLPTAPADCPSYVTAAGAITS